MGPKTDLPTLETVVVSLALVVAMAALRRRRLWRLQGYALGYAAWAAAITVSWGAAKVLGWGAADAFGRSPFNFYRISPAPLAFGLFFLSMWAFWRRRLWFLKGLALYYGLLGGLVFIFLEVFSPDLLLSFALLSVAFVSACTVFKRRGEEAEAASTPSITG